MRGIIEQVWNIPASEFIRLLVMVIAAVLVFAAARRIWVVREFKKVRRRIEQRIRSYEQS